MLCATSMRPATFAIASGVVSLVALIGAVYIVATFFPRSRTATLIGVTPMLGLAGGWASQTIVANMIGQGLSWNKFWMAMGLAGDLRSYNIINACLSAVR